jgi:hypothetical protein
MIVPQERTELARGVCGHAEYTVLDDDELDALITSI